MKILVIGTGAIGACYGGALHKDGNDVVFLSRGENINVIKYKILKSDIYSVSGKLFLQKAEINWYRVFHDLVGDFDEKILSKRQSKAMKQSGLILD